MVFHEKDFKKVDALAHKMVDRAIALDGTCTGEHVSDMRNQLKGGTMNLTAWVFLRILQGVGVGKKRKHFGHPSSSDYRRLTVCMCCLEYLRTELGPGTVEVMKSIKELFDPNGILNPGSEQALNAKGAGINTDSKDLSTRQSCIQMTRTIEAFRVIRLLGNEASCADVGRRGRKIIAGTTPPETIQQLKRRQDYSQKDKTRNEKYSIRYSTRYTLFNVPDVTLCRDMFLLFTIYPLTKKDDPILPFAP